MIFKWETTLINGLRYITSSQFIDEMGSPDIEKGEYPVAFTQPLIDERGNLRWVIDDKYPEKITEVPIAPSPEQLSSEHNASVVKEISLVYTTTDEIKLLNMAVAALSAGEKLPQEYLDYRAAVAAIKETSK